MTTNSNRSVLPTWAGMVTSCVRLDRNKLWWGHLLWFRAWIWAVGMDGDVGLAGMVEMQGLSGDETPAKQRCGGNFSWRRQSSVDPERHNRSGHYGLFLLEFGAFAWVGVPMKKIAGLSSEFDLPVWFVTASRFGPTWNVIQLVI